MTPTGSGAAGSGPRGTEVGGSEPAAGQGRRSRHRSGPRRWVAALPLRSRLALLTAATVALAVAAVAVVCWFLVRGELLAALDDSLRDSAGVPPQLVVDQLESGRCRSSPPRDQTPRPNPFDTTVQVVDRAGGHCVILGRQPLAVTDADTAVASGARAEAVHSVEDSDGTAYRVLTRPARGLDVAVSVARPLSEVTAPLNTLALFLGLVAAAGVLGAAGAGVALARAGLRPVDRLTEVVEHIARTEDLDTRIPVEGDDEIARLSRSFNAMTAALASSRELQQQLIADAGHELRTPLTSLRTNIELLERSAGTGRPLSPEDHRELLASVTAQLGELASLIGDLQELSRPDLAAGGVPATVDFHETVRRAVQRVRPRGPGLRVQVRELSPWYVRGEPALLERAVVNLLDNAVKFGAAGGSVEVSLSASGTLRIRDHGPGVSQEEARHVFDRFWRAPGARGLPGSGLGLSIVARAVRQSGGEVALRPAEGGGTEAVLTLPGAPTPPPGPPVEPSGARVEPPDPR